MKKEDKELIEQSKKETEKLKKDIHNIRKFQENFSMMDKINWGDEEFEKDFKDYFEESYSSQYEWLMLRMAYHYFEAPFRENWPDEDPRSKKDKQKFIKPFLTARDKIQELYEAGSKDGTEILNEIDTQISLLKYPLGGTFGKMALKREAEVTLKEIPMKDYKIKKILEEFSAFRKLSL